MKKKQKNIGIILMLNRKMAIWPIQSNIVFDVCLTTEMLDFNTMNMKRVKTTTLNCIDIESCRKSLCSGFLVKLVKHCECAEEIQYNNTEWGCEQKYIFYRILGPSHNSKKN